MDLTDYTTAPCQHAVEPLCCPSNSEENQSQNETTTLYDSVMRKVESAMAEAADLGTNADVLERLTRGHPEQNLVFVSDLNDDPVANTVPESTVESCPLHSVQNLDQGKYVVETEQHSTNCNSEVIENGKNQIECNAHDTLMRNVDMTVPENSVRHGVSAVNATEDESMSEIPQRNEATNSQSTRDAPSATDCNYAEVDTNELVQTNGHTGDNAENSSQLSFQSGEPSMQQNSIDATVSNSEGQINVVEPILIAPEPNYEPYNNLDLGCSTIAESDDNVNLCFPSDAPVMNIQPIMIEPLSDDSDQDEHPGDINFILPSQPQKCVNLINHKQGQNKF